MRSSSWFFFFSSILFLVLAFIPPTSSSVGRGRSRTYPEVAPSDKSAGEKVDSLQSPPGDFLWPTDASHIVTSTFGEFRQTHFHSGIDISTRNTMGYKVFAAQDGYVWRIRVSPNGYGKMLYLKHENGYITTYAHLKSFKPIINDTVRETQLRLERYPVEIVLDAGLLNVKKGEVIAYTGSSGIGAPHLHFEIRDENLNPINPMTFTHLRVKDIYPPSIRSISISPLSEGSTVGKSQRRLIIKPRLKRHHIYDIGKKIFVKGKIGLGVNARDRMSGTYYPVGIHRLELYVDDSLAFASRFDRLPADGSKQILTFYDLALMKMKKGKFQKLYIEEGTSLPIYEGMTIGAGIIDAEKLVEGTHRFRIVAKDLNGNAAEVRGLFVTERRVAFASIEETKDRLQGQVEKGSARDPYDTYPIHPDTAGWIASDSNMIEIVYDSGAVFRPLSLRLKKEQLKKNKIYRLAPRDTLLNKGFRVFIRRPETLSGPAALYFRDRRYWELRPTIFDSTTGYFSTALTETLGDIALVEDTKPPTIGHVKIRTSRRSPTIRYKLYDGRSGIDANEIKMYIDDVFVIPEIDGERWRVSYEADHRFTRGKHTLRIVVKDKMGNTSSLSRSFTIR